MPSDAKAKATMSPVTLMTYTSGSAMTPRLLAIPSPRDLLMASPGMSIS